MRPEATEMWFIRRILKILWTERKTNEEVLQMAGYSRSLLNTINERQLKFFGHIMRSEKIKKCLMLGKINGRKSRGRQRTKFTDNLKKIVANHISPTKMISSERQQTEKTGDSWSPMLLQ